jgi:hypothetical protein
MSRFDPEWKLLPHYARMYVDKHTGIILGSIDTGDVFYAAGGVPPDAIWHSQIDDVVAGKTMRSRHVGEDSATDTVERFVRMAENGTPNWYEFYRAKVLARFGKRSDSNGK